MAKIDLVPFQPLTKVTAPAPDRPATETPPAEPAPLTKEELKTRVKQDFEAMGWDKPSEAVHQAVEEVVKTSEDAPPVAPAPAAPVVPTEAPPVEAPEEPPLSNQEIIRQTATAVAREVAQAVRPEAAPVAQPERLEMVPEDQEIYEIVKWLEQASPAKYAGIGAKFVDYIRKVYAYQDEWLAKNPGKNFNTDDEENSEFYARNECPVTGDDIDQARIDMAAERKAAERVKPLEEKLNAMETERVLVAAQPAIAQQFVGNAYRLVHLAAPELAKLLTDEQGRVSFSEERIAAVEAADPIARAVFDDMVGRIQPLIQELEKTVVRGANYKLNPENNPVHAELVRYQRQAERDMARAPVNVRTQEGKEWVTAVKFNALRDQVVAGTGSVAEKQAKLAELDARYWCLSVDHLEAMIVQDYAEMAKKEIEKTDSLGKKKYGGAGVRPNAAPTPAPALAVAPAPAPSGRPRSPASSSASDIVTTPQNGVPGQKSFGEQVSGSLFS